jgi:hypothetical protein
MKIRILESVASSVHGTWNVGDVVEWSDKEEAQQLIQAGVAEAVKGGKKAKTETASSDEEVETATTE